MKKKISLIWILFISSISLNGLTQKDTTYISNVIQTLSSAKMEGRLTGSNGELKSAEYLENQFIEFHLTPIGCGIIQPFQFVYYSNSDNNSADSITGLNVIGMLDNQKERTILIGAHYDHIGRNEYLNAKKNEHTGEVHYGADDNASGIALVLELIKHIKEEEPLHQANYIFAFFSGEELGLHGSKAFAGALKKMKIDIDLMLNFDMVGRLDQEKNLYIAGTGTSPIFDSILKNLNDNYRFKLHQDKSGIGGSDYTAFYQDSIPVLSFSSGSHLDYHTIQDTPEKINHQGIISISDFSIDLIERLLKLDVPFAKSESSQSQSRSKLKVSLGIMPAYNSKNGLIIDAVLEGKPAKFIGLQKGDIIIQIDECKIYSIYDYMDCLSNYEVGEQAKITYLRNGESKTSTILFK